MQLTNATIRNIRPAAGLPAWPAFCGGAAATGCFGVWSLPYRSHTGGSSSGGGENGGLLVSAGGGGETGGLSGRS